MGRDAPVSKRRVESSEESKVSSLEGASAALVSETRTPEQLRAVALTVVSCLMEQLTSEVELIDAGAEVLAALGYRVPRRSQVANVKYTSTGRPARGYTPRSARVESPRSTSRRGTQGPICGVYRGTKRGYNKHITSYNTPCSSCTAWRVAQLNRRWDEYGINEQARERVAHG